MQLHLPSNHLISIIPSDKTIIKEALLTKLFSPQDLYLLNLIRMKLQVIFISDLLEPSSNTIKECYWEGKKDRFTFSTYKWLNIEHNNIVLKV